MDIANEFANYLQNAGFGTIGTDIFVGQIPSAQNGIYVVRNGGLLHNYIPIEETVVDVYIKDTSSLTSVQTIESIKRFVHRMHNTLTGNTYIYSMLVLGDVEDLDRDLEYANVYKISVQLKHRYNGAIS